MNRIIWQYWETKGEKPGFIDGLHRIACRNSGCDVILVTPANLHRYLPDVPRDVLRIAEIAHKADMIRAMLLLRYGGMWLDSDAVVLRQLDWLFDLLQDRDFIGFNDQGNLRSGAPFVRVNCLLSRPGGKIVTEWVKQQHTKFPRVKYGWNEIGSELLHPICVKYHEVAKILPFEQICPIPWDRVREFQHSEYRAAKIIQNCYIMMLSNASLARELPQLRRLSCREMAEADNLLGAVMRYALGDVPVE